MKKENHEVKYWYIFDTKTKKSKTIIDKKQKKSEWGNTAENVVKINVPAGTTIFEGFAESQGGFLLGGGSQVVIPNVDPSWVVK